MYEDIKEKFKQLETSLSDPEIINNQDKLRKVSQEHAQIKDVYLLISKLEENENTIKENKEIIENESNKDLISMAKEEIEEAEKQVEILKDKINEELHPDDPNDKKNVIVEIRAGAGGDESALFAADLFKMYSSYCEKKGWKVEILNSSQIGIGGYKEIIFSVTGKMVYADLKYEAGTHRVQRVPETEKQGRVHTSTATVAVLPEAEEVDLEISPSDIRVDTFCSSGPGGQSVNTTYSAIRITHLPTNTVVSCQDQKSQHQNKEKALQVLRSRLLAKAEEEKRKEDSDARKEQVGSGDRSDKVRTYNFPQDRITDHRIKQSWHNMTKILEGDLDEVIDSLKNAQKELNQKNDNSRN
ncbi:peptide chain release factor 1 [bacterium]|nr:peptide chain release factor 1 [bacterium]